ncbi:hypothetical protein [Ekhidna sp.]|uniref:hypothetical protein n=1 Tax=Ekhidna sp. TaxID=2608089 RepID=UPI0032989286
MSRLFFVFLILVACNQQSAKHPVLKYYPSENVFEDGYVSKYYRHYYPKNKDARASTEITYSKFRKEGKRIFIERFNAGFDLVGTTELLVSGSEILVEKLVDIRRTDTIDIEIITPVRSRWDGGTIEPYILRYMFGEKYYRYTEQQLDVYDTLIDGKPGKILLMDAAYTEEDSEEQTNKFTDKSIYLAGLGFYASSSMNENYKLEVELIEQMSVVEFERRADHNKHRIAWIDPDNTLDPSEEFNICGPDQFIADYYNSTPDGRYLHGKRAMLDTVFQNLDESKLLEQNGMLIFRFVVNCEGKAGRFIVDGYDFMYQPIQFEQETIEHLHSILKKLEDWRPVVIDAEPRDAYFYVNFKIENGKITDILP